MPESSRRTNPSLSRGIDLARAVLADVPAGLLTDFDGTLSPIVTDATLSRLVDGADGALAMLAERLAVVAIVTGRAPLDARRMTGVPGLLVAGNHGTEWLEPNADTPEPAPEAASVRARLDAVVGRLPQLAGVVVEHKGLSAAVHFRNAPDPVAARAAIREALGAVEEHGIELGDGRMIVEVRPIGLGDKGSAARAIVHRFGLRGVVVMGDDTTDLDMFGAVAEMRASGTLRGVIIGVGGGDREVPSSVVEASDLMLAHPEEAAALLVALARDWAT